MSGEAIRRPIRFLWERWLRVVDAFSWLVTRVALTLLFFTAFVVYGALLRVLRRDPLGRTIDRERESYWGEYFLTNETLDDFRRQY